MNNDQETLSVGFGTSDNDELSSSDDSSSKEFVDTSDLHDRIEAEEAKMSDDLNDSEEYHDVECVDSNDSFVSSLEQMVVGDECTPDTAASNEQNPDGDRVALLTSFGLSDRNVSMVVVEETEEVDGQELPFILDTDIENRVENEIETVKTSESDPKRIANTAKITFYCESVNKLTTDSGGEECDEIIQEVTL